MAYARTSVIFNDGPTFIGIAQRMAAGEWTEALAHPFHPLYPLMIRGAYVVIPDWEVAASVLSIVGGALAVVALYALLRVAFDDRVAFIGGLLLALHPYAIRFSADVQSDSIHLALWLFSAALLYRGLRDARPTWALASGLLSGLAYLTRPEGATVVVVGLGLASAAWLRGSWRTETTLRFGAALLTGIALPALPYLLALRSLAGGWRFSQKKSVFELIGVDAVAAGEGAGLPLWLAVLLLTALLVALATAWRTHSNARGREAARFRLCARVLAGVAVFSGIGGALLAPDVTASFAAVWVSTLRPEQLVLVTLGIASLAHAGPKGRGLFFASFEGLYAGLLFGLLLHYGYLSRRHALPPVALLMGYGALGVLWIANGLERLTNRDDTSATTPALRWIGIVLLAIAAISLPKAWSDHRAEELAGRRAAEWLREHGDTPGVVASQRSKLGYYAERDWRPLSAEGQLRTIDRLRSEGVRWIIIDGREPRPLGPHPELVERHRTHDNGHEARVYELIPLIRAQGMQ